jgi:hypothetical protein
MRTSLGKFTTTLLALLQAHWEAPRPVSCGMQ